MKVKVKSKPKLRLPADGKPVYIKTGRAMSKSTSLIAPHAIAAAILMDAYADDGERNIGTLANALKFVSKRSFNAIYKKVRKEIANSIEQWRKSGDEFEAPWRPRTGTTVKGRSSNTRRNTAAGRGTKETKSRTGTSRRSRTTS